MGALSEKMNKAFKNKLLNGVRNAKEGFYKKKTLKIVAII